MSQQRAFTELLDSIKRPPENKPLNPELDKVEKEHIKTFSETEALQRGALRSATFVPGEGSESPKDGDLVYVHFSIHAGENEDLIFTTRSDEWSAFAFILSEAPRMPRGLELVLTEMKNGEKRAVQIQPEFGFKHPECEYHLPGEDLLKYESEVLMFDLQLLNWYDASDVMKIGSSPSWISKRILDEGEGFENPRAPYEVCASIKARQPASDGNQLEGDIYYETKEDGLNVAIGSDGIPKGIEAALCSMVKQERSVFVIPTELMSGPSCKMTGHPQNLQQVEVEIHIQNVIQVRDMYGDGNLIKRRLVEGVGEFPVDCPMHDCLAHVHYKARPAVHANGLKSNPGDDNDNDWVFNSRDVHQEPLEVELGCGILPEGIEACIRLMLPQEISLIHSQPKLAYGDGTVDPPLGISTPDVVEFEVELINFDRDSQWIGADAPKALELAEKIKEIANKLFKEGKYGLAAGKYKTVIQNLDAFRNYETEEEIVSADAIKLACLGNLALCATQQEDYSGAVEWCNKALRVDDENPKMYFRRGRAHSLKGDFENAESDFAQVLELDSSLAEEVNKEQLRNKHRKKAALQKQKKEFGSFFDRTNSGK